jgi:SpoVK/Ycf46/Vps4 family AAA+-type ATPase
MEVGFKQHIDTGKNFDSQFAQWKADVAGDKPIVVENAEKFLYSSEQAMASGMLKNDLTSMNTLTESLTKKSYMLLGGFTGIKNESIKLNDVLYNMGETTIGVNLKDDVKDFIEDEESGLAAAQWAAETLNTSLGEDIEKTVMLGLIKKQTGSNILFRGEPGTGKTELAKTLSQHAKGKAYMMDSLSTCKPSMRLFTILRNIHLLKKGDLIIIDEAESILGELSDFRSSIDKGQINGFLDSVKEQNVIWIVNYLDNLDKSTIRRFDYNLAFGKPTDKQRKRTWENAISEFNLSGMVSKPEVDVLYKSYPLDFGSITSALMRYKSIVGERERNFKIGILIELLNSSMSLSNKKANSGNSLVPLSDNYDISILNTDCSIDQAVASVQSFYELEEKGDAGIKFLLHGLPGTGKTEFAKYMSATAERPLIVKNMSDLLDKYVGETEKHIAQSFKEAKDSNAILLLDEADGLFSKRVNARASWEVNQTNELLSQVENYPGVLICATNLLQNIDGAAIRRFQWKIKFSPLKPDKRLVLFNQYFPKLADNLSSIDEGKIKRLDGLTPGMLNIVKQKYIYLKDIQSATVILDELMREVSYQRETIDQKEFQIGFCG